MEFEGIIEKVTQEASGTSQSGNAWRKREFIFAYFENPTDRFPEKVVLPLMNDKLDMYNPQEHDVVRIGYGHRVREYNNRFYTENYIYKYEVIKKHNAPAEAAGALTDEQKAAIEAAKKIGTDATPQPEKKEDDDDLPF